MPKFTLFTENQKSSILKDYNEIIQSNKSYRSFTMEKLQNATKGMYIKHKEN